MVTIQFTTNTLAFRNPYTGKEDVICKELESVRILKHITKEIEFFGKKAGTIVDINDTEIGEWSI